MKEVKLRKEIFNNKILNIKDKGVKEILRFGIVGGLNTIIDFLVFTILIYIIGLKPGLSQSISYSVGAINSFILNKKWTFKIKKSDKLLQEIIRFVIINGISLVVSTGAMVLITVNFLLNAFLAKIFIIILTQVINYFGYKFLVFNLSAKNG